MIRKATFIKSAPSRQEAPELRNLPEFVMVGRSNVGKSSLINTLTGQKNLAKTSKTPGKTRLINFFLIDDTWVLVDLPGYGYAKVSKTEQAQWQENLEDYLKNRQPLCRAVQLVDSRHGIQPSDAQMFGWLTHYGHVPLIALTKTDQITPHNLQLQKQQTAITFKIPTEDVFPVSARTKSGMADLYRRLLADVKAYTKPNTP